MPTVAKTFSFLSDTEGFFGTAGGNSVLTYDPTMQALKSRISGRAKSNANYWEWTGKWETLGVPAGATVTAIRLQSGVTRCTEYSTGAPSTIGPYTLRDSAGTQQAVLWAGRTVSASETSWYTAPQQPDQSIPEALQASGTTVKIRLADTLATGASSSAAVSAYDDEVALVITYTSAAPVSGSGGVSFGLGVAAVATSKIAATAALAFGLALSGQAVTAAPAPATGTGALAFSASLSASATQRVRGTGALSFAPSVAATGRQTVRGSGGFAFISGVSVSARQTLRASGAVAFSPGVAANTRQTFRGSGALAFRASVSGSATVAQPAVRTGTAGPAFAFGVSGTASQTIRSTAALAFLPSLSGEVRQTVSGSAEIAFAPAISGEAVQTITGAGAMAFPLGAAAVESAPVITPIPLPLVSADASGLPMLTARENVSAFVGGPVVLPVIDARSPRSSTMRIYTQDPAEKLFYRQQIIGDSVASATWTIEPTATLDMQTQGTDYAQVRVSGLSAGTYTLRARIVGTSAAEYSRSVRIKCEAR